MKFVLAVNDDSFDKAWTELEMLAPQLIDDMTIASGRTVDSKRFIVVVIKEIDDTSSLMKTLVEMTKKGIHWSLETKWWYSHVKED